MSAWILGLMLLMQPRAPWLATYAITSASIAEVVEAERPLFDGAHGRERTAALLVSLAWFESTFQPDALGDKGKAHGLYQVHGHGELGEPLEATRVALAMIRQSFAICRARPLEERLAWYAQGGADCSAMSAEALKKSRHRIAKAMWLARRGGGAS
jgi:hypothetical protein